MTSSRERLVKAVKQFVEVRYKVFGDRYGQNIIDILDFPIKVVLSPFTLAFDIAGSAPRGFGVPELISKLSATSVFVSPFSPFLLFFFSLTFRSISLLFFCYSISLSNFWVFEEMEIIKMSFSPFTIPPSMAVRLFQLNQCSRNRIRVLGMPAYTLRESFVAYSGLTVRARAGISHVEDGGYMWS